MQVEELKRELGSLNARHAAALEMCGERDEQASERRGGKGEERESFSLSLEQYCSVLSLPCDLAQVEELRADLADLRAALHRQQLEALELSAQQPRAASKGTREPDPVD